MDVLRTFRRINSTLRCFFDPPGFDPPRVKNQTHLFVFLVYVIFCLLLFSLLLLMLLPKMMGNKGAPPSQPASWSVAALLEPRRLAHIKGCIYRSGGQSTLEAEPVALSSLPESRVPLPRSQRSRSKRCRSVTRERSCAEALAPPPHRTRRSLLQQHGFELVRRRKELAMDYNHEHGPHPCLPLRLKVEPLRA